ncbi:MAG: response regulator [Spirochaetia bacterium]|jgi:two-component system chemotaxis response regulator CheY|nr:response regulator [Spirochaetia bacterium]
MAVVLIADDSWIARMNLVKILKSLPVTLLELEDGVMAMKMIRLEKPDLILLDLLIPEMDGQTLLRKFREIEKEHGILGSMGCKIIMSALDDAGNVMEAFKNQCDGYLTKPYNRKSLVSELRKLELIE